MKKKSNLDEAQELEMLKIEHNCYQIAFWGLLAAILIQTAVIPGNLLALAGEWSVFMIMCVCNIAGCLKNGIWDRKFKPNGKTNFLLSLFSSLLYGLYWTAASYYRYGKLLGSMATGLFTALSGFALIYAALNICTRLYKKRVKKLDSEIEET